MNIQTPTVSGYLTRRLRTEAEAKAEIIRRHAAELNALIRQADAAFALKVDDGRRQYAMLLRRLPWDYQADTRTHELIVFCEELIGEGVGEQLAWSIMCERGAR